MVAAADDRVSDEDVKVIERSACPTCGSCSGMFTANSMNCLTEALGLSLPGNGSTLATHADRRRLFVEAGHLIVDLARRYYEQDDASVLPRSIASFAAFENAMTLDIAMGGSTNTVLHLLAAAHEAELDFTMADIDRLSRRVPVLCKVAPAKSRRPHGGRAPRRRHHGDPRRARPRRPDRHRDVPTVHAATLGEALDRWDIARTESQAVRDFFMAAPGGVPTQVAFSQDRRWDALDLDRETGVIRGAEHAFSKDGGLAVLYGNLADDGCIVKTAGVDESILNFSGPARVFESQDAAVQAHPRRQGQGGRRRRHPLRGPARRPGHAGDALPDELPEVEGPRQSLRARSPTDASRAAPPGLSIGHVSPEAAEGGAHRAGRGGRPDRDRHPEPHGSSRGRRRRDRQAARGAGRERAGSPRNAASGA